MAKQVRWTERSLIDRALIYSYWLHRNQSDEYPEYLEDLFERTGDLIALFPQMGVKTKHTDVYLKVVRNFKLFYRVKDEYVEFLRVWDSRQEPGTERV